MSKPKPRPESPAPTSEMIRAADFRDVLKREIPEVFKNQPPDRIDRVIAAVATRISIHSGPLPRPEDIAEYNKHITDGANRIMAMAEDQSKHRIGIEDKVIDAQILQSGRGQWFGLLIALVGIGATVFLAMNGHDAVAGIIGGTTLIALVAAFLTGKSAQKQDIRSKRDASGG